MLDGLPFMPEMIRYCGRRLIVDKRAERLCDTIYPLASMVLPETVLLGNIRCNGSGHDGCQADCRLYWKVAWLRRPSEAQSAAVDDDASASAELAQLAAANTRRTVEVDGQPSTRYQCQATELHRASRRLQITDIRGYLRVYTSGNV